GARARAGGRRHRPAGPGASHAPPRRDAFRGAPAGQRRAAARRRAQSHAQLHSRLDLSVAVAHGGAGMVSTGWTGLVLAAAVLLAGCTSIDVEHLPKSDALALVDDPEGASDPQYRIRAGDDLDIKFFYTKELNESLKVRPDGYITLQLVDDVKAAGLTPKELDDVLTRRYAEHLKSPVLSVMVRSFSGFRAYVGGEVASPQLVPLDGGLTPLQAIYRAGGVRMSGYMQSVVLIRKGPDGRPVPYQLDLSEDALSKGARDLRIAL